MLKLRAAEHAVVSGPLYLLRAVGGLEVALYLGLHLLGRVRRLRGERGDEAAAVAVVELHEVERGRHDYDAVEVVRVSAQQAALEDVALKELAEGVGGEILPAFGVHALHHAAPPLGVVIHAQAAGDGGDDLAALPVRGARGVALQQLVYVDARHAEGHVVAARAVELRALAGALRVYREVAVVEVVERELAHPVAAPAASAPAGKSPSTRAIRHNIPTSLFGLSPMITSI